MSKKTITIEIDTDELFNLLKSENNVTLKLTVTRDTIVSDRSTVSHETIPEYLSPEDKAFLEKQIHWPF